MSRAVSLNTLTKVDAYVPQRRRPHLPTDSSSAQCFPSSPRPRIDSSVAIDHCLTRGKGNPCLFSLTVPQDTISNFQNVGVHFETWNTGVLDPVTLKGLNSGTWDMSTWKWSYKVGLKGETQHLNTVTGSSSVEWIEGSLLAEKQPLTWYKATFCWVSYGHSGRNDPLALDMGSMGKGQMWINGQSIGRHWPAYLAQGSCNSFSYAGTFHENKCRSNCEQPSQRWYHVPRAWLNPTGNLLVMFEEWGGDPTLTSLVTRTAV